MRVIILILYIVFMFSCAEEKHDVHNHDIQNEQEHNHEHEGHDHDTDKHDHDTDEHDHGHEGHDHDTDEHDCKEHDHDCKEHDHNGEEHDHSGEVHENESTVIFSNEEADNIDFKTILLKKSTFQKVIKTSGMILPAQQDEKIINAKTSGIVSFGNRKILPGKRLKAGETILSISGKGFVDNNISVKHQNAIANYEKAKKDFERAEKLYSKKIISEKEYLLGKTEYEKSKASYNNISSKFKSGGIIVSSPLSGFVQNIYVKEGEFVEEGTALFTVIKNNKLVVKADVSQRHYKEINKITSANILPEYENTVISLDELNGRIISRGQSVDENSMSIPVYFEIDNKRNLIPGSYIEVYLLGRKIKNTIKIPKSAVLEEGGSNSVFVKISDESYIKKVIIIDGYDGKNYHVISGLKEGERVVSKGAYRILLASKTSALPDHGHVH